MSYLADYELTALGNVKVQNYVTYVDKRNGYVVMEFDARGKDWLEGSPYPQAILLVEGAVAMITNLTDLSNTWKRYRLNHYIALTSENKYYTDEATFTLRIHDEANTGQDFDMAGITLDLDPVEYHMTVLQEVDFGDISAPGINFTLKDLHNKNQTMTPVVTNTASGATSDQVAVTCAGITAVYASGYVILNGVIFSDSDLLMSDADGNASKARWAKATNYLVDTPALATGNNSFSIDLVCRNL